MYIYIFVYIYIYINIYIFSPPHSLLSGLRSRRRSRRRRVAQVQPPRQPAILFLLLLLLRLHLLLPDRQARLAREAGAALRAHVRGALVRLQVACHRAT